MNAICLVVDRLHVGHLGAYGNAWVETPTLDRLASEAFLFDQFLIDTPRLESLYRSYWQGQHALQAQTASAEDRPALPGLLRQVGVATTLVTDEPIVARHPVAGGFDDVIELDPPQVVRSAQQIEDTHLARFFAQIIRQLESTDEPFLMWCHARGLGGPWDAPLDFRNRYAEEDDPTPPDSAEVPSKKLKDDYDPDQLLGIAQAYAGQVSALDVCVGAFLEFLDGSPLGQNTLLTLLSARGFPLGEHRRIGPCDEALYSELVHVPLVIRYPDALGAAARSRALVQPADVWATLLDWWKIPQPAESLAAKSLTPLVTEEVESIRDRLCIAGVDGFRAIRTPAWHLRDAAEPELFAKPDDRWEVNSVADRYPELVDSLREAVAGFEQFLCSGQSADLTPLDAVLLTGLD